MGRLPRAPFTKSVKGCSTLQGCMRRPPRSIIPGERCQMSDVFISFIHEESETAEALQGFVNQMLSGQAQAFLSSDKFQVYAGEDWLGRIFDELKSAKVVLLLLSETSVKRPWVNFEAGAGWFTGKKVIPVCIKTMEKEKLPKPYSSLQAVELKYSDEQRYLIRSIAHHLGVKEPLIADKFAGGLAALGGPESEKEAEIQSNYLKQFQADLKNAARVEDFLERHRDDLKMGKMGSLRDLSRLSDKPEDE
jgi:TIR domain